MAYINNNGQVRIGVRAAIVNSPVQQQQVISASLLQSLYGLWNGDTTTNELGTSLYGVWNAEYSGTASLETSLYGVWNGESTTNTLDTSIYALYKAEGNANDSIGTNHGTLMNGATFSTGKIGTKSFYFDGVNDYISLPNNSLNFTGDFSISVWVDVSGISNWSHSFDVINNLSGNYGWRLSNNGNAYYFEIGNGTSITQLYFNSAGDGILPSAQVSPLIGSAMKNVVITRKAGVGTKMYISGVLKLSNTSTANPSYLATMSPKFGNGNVITKLDNICFWNKELSQLEVSQLYNNNVGVDYPFNGNLLASPVDAFGTNHGVVMNGCNFTTGKFVNAFSFDGVDDYVQLPTNSLNFTDDFSVSFWVYFNNGNSKVLNNNGSIISAYNNTGAQEGGWVIRATSTNSFRFVILPKNNTSAVSLDTANNTFIANQWNHVVVTRKRGTSSKIYVNGSLSVSNTSSVDPLYYTTSNCSIGALIGDTIASYSNINYVDALSTWTRELSANEVSMLYNSSNGTQYQSGSFGLTQSSLDSFGTSHGINVGGVTYTTGKVGNSFTFNGTNAYVNFPTNSWNSTVGTDFSISLWVKFTSTATQTIISNMSSPSINNWSGWEIRLISGRPIIHMWNNAGVAVGPQGSVISTNTWYHIVATRKKGSRTRIYMNGSLEQTDTTNTNDPSINGTYYPNIGHLQYASSGHWNYMANGSLIDSVNLWNREISADEVTQLYNSGTGTQYPFFGTFSSAGNQLGMDNGTLMNGASLSTGKIGQAFTFDGVNDYVSLPDNSLNFTGDFSVSAWIYVSNLSGEKYIISNVNGNALDVNIGWCFGVFDNKVSFWVYPQGSSYTGWLTNTTILLNTWYHVSVTKKPSQSPLIYINGTLSSTSLYNNSMSSSINPIYSTTTYPNTKASIGVYRYNNGSSAYAYFNGKIDALNVYQKELTQSEITELYNSGTGKQITSTPIVQTGLVLNLDASRKSSYPNTGTTWTDISGSGNNGTLTNGPIFGTASGGQISFDGVNDYVDTGLQYSLTSSTNFTIGIWFKGFGRASNNDILVLSYSGTPVGWAIYQANTGKFMCFSRDNNNVETTYISSTTSTNTNQWFYGVYKKSGNQFSLYINGVLEATTNANLGNISISSGMRIGNHTTTSQPYLGSIGSVKVYNKSLTDSEILQNFNATKSRFGY